jgi:response regulator of citrate/malate metabolism
MLHLGVADYLSTSVSFERLRESLERTIHLEEKGEDDQEPMPLMGV